MSVPSPHNSKQIDDDDLVEQMLKKTGCMELHYQVQECIAETQDWRKCQEPVQKLKVCMTEYQKKQRDRYQ